MGKVKHIAKLTVKSPAFKHNEPIPEKYSLEGNNVSPPIAISGVPIHVLSICIIVDDPDAPLGDFVHWIAWDLDPDSKRIKTGAKLEFQGRNDYGKIGWGGPCPTPGRPHHYHFKGYAVDKFIRLPPGSTKSQLLKEMEGHILGEGLLVGTFERKEY